VVRMYLPPEAVPQVVMDTGHLGSPWSGTWVQNLWMGPVFCVYHWIGSPELSQAEADGAQKLE
jgi:hypothetical protein